MFHETLLQVVLDSLWFFLPAFVANGAPPVLAQLPVLRDWDTPIDNGQEWRGKPVLGSHKTWRGLLGGVLLGVFAAYLQDISLSYALSLTGAALLAVGALTGDLVKSFVKRRLDVEPGNPWIPWDQVDYVLGGFAFTLLVNAPPLKYFAALLVLAPLTSITANHVFYWLGFQDEAW